MMSPITSSKLFSNMDNVFMKKPVTLDCFITNFCNNRCPHCTYGRWRLEPGAREMPFEDFVKYIKRAIDLGVKGVILTGGGEPTLHSRFDDMCEFLDDEGIAYGINTNFNNPKFIRPAYLKVSLDGWDEQSYKKIRGVEAYRKTRDAIFQYAEWKSLNSPKTQLGAQQISKTSDDVFRFYEANKDLPVDYFVFRPVESTRCSFYADNETAKSEALNIKQAVLELAKDDFRVKLNPKFDQLEVFPELCSANWAQLAIDERGRVIYCCHKPFETVGHIMDDDILEKKKRFATDMSKCDVPCRLTSSNIIVEMINKKQMNSEFI